MGLFKWAVKIGEYGEYIADGYVFAESKESAYEKVKFHYLNPYHNVVIENDWNFFYDTDDLNPGSYEICKKFDDGVVVRWED